MGTQKSGKSGLGEALFTKTQRQVLGLLFGRSDESFYTKEIVRHAGVGIGAVQRELEKLVDADLVTAKKVGNQKHYQANPLSPIFEELKGLIQKSFGLTDILKEALREHLEKIKVAFIYGSIARGEETADSDIDIMIISDKLTYPDTIELLADVEAKLGRTINPSLYSPGEIEKKIREKNSFVTRVLNQEKIMLAGAEDDLPKYG